MPEDTSYLDRPVRMNAALPAGEAHLGEVGGNTKLITVPVTVSLTAYANGDSVGGKLILADAARVSGGTAVLQSIHLLDRANQKPALEILFFDADPTAATITDNAAFVSGADDLKELGRVSVAAADWTTLNSKARATLRGIGLVLKPAAGTALYVALVLNGSTPTFVAADDVQLRFGLLRD